MTVGYSTVYRTVVKMFNSPTLTLDVNDMGPCKLHTSRVRVEIRIRVRVTEQGPESRCCSCCESAGCSVAFRQLPLASISSSDEHHLQPITNLGSWLRSSP